MAPKMKKSVSGICPTRVVVGGITGALIGARIPDMRLRDMRADSQGEAFSSRLTATNPKGLPMQRK